MADEGVYTTNAQIQAFAGTNAGTTAKAVTATDVYVLMVEAMINDDTSYNWSDDFGGLDVDTKGILSLAGATKCAMIVVNADPTGYTARERETHLDFLNTLYDSAIKVLLDKNKSAFIRGEST